MPTADLKLSEMKAGWAAEFPGSSLLIVVLRTALALADWHARHIQAQFLHLHQDLQMTGLPMQFWNADTRQTYQFMERASGRAQREFRQALRALQASYKKPEAAKPVPPPPKPPEKLNLQQTLYVTVEDGMAKTATEMGADFFRAMQPEHLEAIGWVTRQFRFENGVPGCYAGLLTHQGLGYEPKGALRICYRIDDFLRLCQREIDTGSPHVLDDEDCREDYRWTAIPANEVEINK